MRISRSDPFAPFDVIVVPFPYSDRLAEKRRPALVISTPALAELGMLWVAMITSAGNEAWSCDVPIADLRRAGLPSPSVIRPAKIAAIEPSRVIRRAGAVDASAARRVAERLAAFLARARTASSR